MSAQPHWPGDASTVEQWLESLVHQEVGDYLGASERTRIEVTLHGDDLALLRIDGSNLTVHMNPEISAPLEDSAHTQESSEEPQLVASRTGTIQDLILQAQPIYLDEVPLRAHLRMHNIPIVWDLYTLPLQPAKPTSGREIRLNEEADPSRMRGSADISVKTSDLESVIQAMLTPAVADLGATLRRMEVTVEQVDPQLVSLSAVIRFRRSFLRATVRIHACVRISPEGLIAVEDLRVKSRNPLVALMLLFARNSIRKIQEESLDLNEELGLGSEGLPRVSDLRVRVDENITLTARLL
ncbi:hypothetical protein [Nesterenkonia muleiensis]|uniref:hypothetical protein n=1 Tax=Nesterenkonia muleiensis TaxID=2282648 RepID=UPI000E70C127|nr:hypothetical protein [Nesterenkonia muleiensis]